MAATNAQRKRAGYIRGKQRAGVTIDAEDLAWLADYEKGRSRRGRKPAPMPAPASTVPAFVPEPPIVSVPPMGPTPPPAPSKVDQQMVPIAFDPAPSAAQATFGSPAPTPFASACTIVNCPCKTGGSGGEFCPTLQKKIYPPMDEDAARGFAASILNLIAFIGRFAREDKRYIRPTEQEIAKFGRAIRLVQMRRANWAGAWDDLMAFGWAIGAYSMRVINEPSEKKTLPAPRVSVPSPESMREPEPLKGVSA